LSTKIHVCCDALGQTVRCLLSSGQEADITHARALIEGIETQALLADKGYDANELLQTLASREIEAVIPPRKNRCEQREYDRQAYKHRNLVQRLFNRLKQFRRVATRYDKLARSFLGVLCLACWFIQTPE
jgi:transposase